MVECGFRVGFRGLALVAAAGLLTACGGGGDSASSANATGDSTTPPASTVAPQNQAPVLAGNAPTTAAVGEAYSFTPTATDADHDSLKFSIASKPSWATFNASTGQLTGTPATTDVGAHEEIQIAATDGKATTELPAFSITVEAASADSGNVTVSWTPPQTNTDGSPLMNLSGYKIHYGTTSKSYTKVIPINTVGMTNYVVENLTNGTYYFSITAISSAGAESEYSSEVSAKIG